MATEINPNFSNNTGNPNWKSGSSGKWSSLDINSSSKSEIIERCSLRHAYSLNDNDFKLHLIEPVFDFKPGCEAISIEIILHQNTGLLLVVLLKVDNFKY